MPVTELLVDDEPLVRAGPRAVLEARSGIEVVGEATGGAAVIPPVRQLRPDVVATDVRMPLVDGIEAPRAVLRSVSGTSRAGAVPAKLGARNRTQTVITAYESGFVAPR